MDAVQDGELALLELGQIPLLKDQQIVVPGIAAEDASHGGGPLVQPGVDLGQESRAGVVGQALQKLLVVVQLDNGGHGAGGVILLPDRGEFGHIHPVGGGQEGLAVLVVRTDQMAEDHKAGIPYVDLCGAFILPLHQPAGGEVGHGGGELGVEKVLPLTGEGEKALVGPDDLVGLRLEYDHGQGRVHHGVLGGHVDIAGHIVDIF